jgi:prepilin-type N-terminal cleavage/methylation domain-containing protein
MNGRTGFTLIEVIIALVILTVVVLGMAMGTGRFMHTVAEADRRGAALQLAADRLDLILLDLDYSGLDTLYVASESGFVTLPGMVRTTEIVQVGGPQHSRDHKKITVTVNGPGLVTPVTRSATVAAP